MSRSFAVGVPIIRDDKVSHVLIAYLDLAWYDRLLNQQGQPEGAVAGLFDRQFSFVARSAEGDARRGQGPAPELVADMKLRREGLRRYTNLNGTAVYTAWTFTRHGWSVGFATPSAPVDDAFRRHLLLFGFLWAVAVGAGMLYAFSKAPADRGLARVSRGPGPALRHGPADRELARFPRRGGASAGRNLECGDDHEERKA